MNTNTYTPSKELLLVVLGFKIDCIFISGQIVEYDYISLPSLAEHSDEISIYELAIKTKQKYPDIDLNLAATDISEFWRQANELVRGASNE